MENQNNGTLAMLDNVFNCAEAMETVINRPEHLSEVCMIAFYGAAGRGKSKAACYTANQFRAYHIEAKSCWTAKAFLKNLCKEMGLKKPAGVVYELVEQVSEQLASSGRPLIIDEFDHVIKKGYVELIRDISDGTYSPIMIIGEENIDVNLARHECVSRRILDWIPAKAADIEDARVLRELYCKQVAIADDLLEAIVEVSKGSISRVCTNLNKVQQAAQSEGLSAMDKAAWGSRRLDNGKAPTRRA